MTSSMYAAIAGLNAHMQKMGVIGNNIANANTYGFKPGVTSFTESIYTSIGTSTAGGAVMGGTNPSQIGYGSKISGIDVSMAAGVPAPTGVNSDLYLNGSGFFLVGPKPTNEAGYVPEPDQLMMKRVGDFKIDEDGYLVDSEGNCVYGFMPLAGGEGGDNVPGAISNPVEYDTCLRPLRLPAYRAEANGNEGIGSPVYPTLGDDPANSLDYGDLGDNFDEEKRVDVNSLNLSYGENGVITGTTNDGKSFTLGVIAMGNVRNPNGLTKKAEGYYLPGGNSGEVTVSAGGGILDGKFLNNSEDGAETKAPGDDTQLITSGGETKILSGFREASRTDVSTEFTELITTQRGFQANTKIITVTDEMLAELVNMKR